MARTKLIVPSLTVACRNRAFPRATFSAVIGLLRDEFHHSLLAGPSVWMPEADLRVAVVRQCPRPNTALQDRIDNKPPRSLIIIIRGFIFLKSVNFYLVWRPFFD